MKKLYYFTFFILFFSNLSLADNKIMEIIDGKKLYFVSNNSEKKYVPSFLVENNNEEIEDIQIYNGLKLVSDYLDKSILKPNNISQPKSRVEFINLLKE